MDPHSGAGMIPEGKRFKFYRKSSFGVSTWTTWYIGNVIYYSSAVAEGGAEKQNAEEVEINHSGRGLQDQIELQMRSRLSRMLDRGYKSTREEALNGATNQLGLINPMLAQPLTKIATPYLSAEEPGYMQIKYDGHRCLVTRYEGKLFAYTRKGKEIKTMGHILQVLDSVIPEDTTLDGELYIHGLPLQTISSIIKRDQVACKDLCYHVYDIVDPEPFAIRWKRARSYIDPVAKPSVYCVPTDVVTSLAGVYEHFRRSRATKHEGSMLRLSTRGYEDGKRSDQLIKVKERDDEDFEVVDVVPGKHQVGILVLRLNDRAATFDCLAPGSVPQKQEILANKHKYIGRKVTVAFAHKTNDGVPFHGVALRFVEEL
jgi:DNA ligase 1